MTFKRRNRKKYWSVRIFSRTIITIPLFLYCPMKESWFSIQDIRMNLVFITESPEYRGYYYFRWRKEDWNKNNTTYPSPFILSDDPEHIYLCWRGIGWHPTIAKLSLPDDKDEVDVVWGPYQIVQSTGARPYAKYMSNGKDKIYLTYTTGHPDNELPNFLYFNYIDIKTLQLTDVREPYFLLLPTAHLRWTRQVIMRNNTRLR